MSSKDEGRRTFSAVPGDSRCECSDPGCLAHKGQDEHSELATTILYRVDMIDETGTAMCDDCADDAYESGVFTDRFDDDDEL